MALAFYKPGQGYWTRMMSAIGAGVLVLAGVGWIWNELDVIRSDSRLIVQAIVAAVIILGAGGVLMWLLGIQSRIVDFMIATEAEMRKVSWPSKREIIISTWVVICGTFLMAGLLFLVDIVFAWFFKSIGVLNVNI